MVSQDVSRSTDETALIACLCVAVVAVLMRTFARWYKLRAAPFEVEDVFMYLALVSFAITTALYLATIPTFFNLAAITEGRMMPYASLERDLVVMLKEFFVVQFFFWLTLWAVKWSLLFMFRRLTDGINFFNKVWWAIFVFSILTFIGCCISNFTSCSSMEAWFTAGDCLTPRDARAKNISLWFSLAADLSTDLLIMITPIRVLWNLKLALVEKISVGIIFAVGIFTMVTAIIRSVSLDSSASSGQVSTTWLMLWAAIEGVVAIIVGCLPSFAIFVRGRVTASRAARYNQGSSSNKNSSFNSRAKSSRGPQGSVRLPEEDGPPWRTNDTASDKSLVQPSGGITVTRSWSQNWHGGAGGRGSQKKANEAAHEAHELSSVGK